MTLKEATNIVRNNGYSIGMCSNKTRRLTFWENSKITFEQYVTPEEFKQFAEKLSQPENKAKNFARMILEK